ncbi:hypothetical protein EDD18DRAFT_1348938 [Armillaria luteobubalina]|uniref:F-box domain-containing protein n=1 Tax=Armillaria luteobubalina TaxID=153913 RepID=A0AA39QDY6_9AGAR|nr:hypothetical protein EDD18DRAFT_1348938 [Armillaria luteobubalina]
MTMLAGRDVPLSVPDVNYMVTMDNAIALLHVVKKYEAECTVTELVNSYTSGDHPYFQYQTSMISLVAKDGHVFYSSMLQCLLEYERTHPGIVKSNSFPPSPISVIVRHPSAIQLSHFPHELLEHMFRFMAKSQLLVARCVCQSWCFSASHISHCAILLCLHTDWQTCIGSRVPDKEGVEAYALLSQLALVCASVRWQFARHDFQHVHTVSIRGLSSVIRHFPLITPSYLLLASIRSLHLYQCSLHSHSLEALLSQCDNICFLSIIVVHCGHLYVPASGVSTDIDVAAWHEDSGITTYLHKSVSSPSKPTLYCLRIDFPDDMPDVLSYNTDINGIPPLLNQIFTPVGNTSCMEPFLADVKVYPLRLHMDNVCYLDLRMSQQVTYMFPCIVCTVGDTLHNLHLYYGESYAFLCVAQIVDATIAPSTNVCDLHSFTLDGFSELRTVQVSMSLGDLVSVLLPISMWTPSPSAASTSELCLNVLMGHNQVDDTVLEPVTKSVRSVLIHHFEGECRPFCGTFKLALVYSEASPHIASDVDAFKLLLLSVGMCEDMGATICTEIEVAVNRDLYVSGISD